MAFGNRVSPRPSDLTFSHSERRLTLGLGSPCEQRLKVTAAAEPLPPALTSAGNALPQGVLWRSHTVVHVRRIRREPEIQE